MLTHGADLSSRSGVEAHPTIPQPLYPRRRWPWVVGALVAIAIAAAAVWYFVLRDTGPANEVTGPSSAPFSVDLPQGWKPLAADQLEQLAGSPLALLKKADGTGVVIINAQPPTAASLQDLAKRLETKLADTIPDFKLIDEKTINVKAGQAASITYAREKKGTANSLVVVPAGGHVYTLSATVPSGEKIAAQQVQAIISSFDA